MNGRRTWWVLALLLSCAGWGSAQDSRCALKHSQLTQAPELRGLRLGMTIDQVMALVPALQLGPVDGFGLSQTSFSPDFSPKIDKAAFEHVRTVSLEFLDGRLTSLWIGYTAAFKWKTLDEFIPGMTTALGLPKSEWRTKLIGRQLDCDDLEVAAMMVAGGPSVRLTDKVAKQLWDKRRADHEAQRAL